MNGVSTVVASTEGDDKLPTSQGVPGYYDDVTDSPTLHNAIN